MGFPIQVQGVSQTYASTDETASVDALRNIDLEITDGEFVALMGASGSGKSTLLNLLGCIDRPTSGSIVAGPHSITSMNEKELTLVRRKDIGYIFQFFHLIPTLSVEENVAFPLALAGTGSREMRERTEQTLDEVGLASRATHFPNQLSGGEMQRVAIGRAIIHRPQLLLADEPTGNLDSKTGERILALIDSIHSSFRPTIVMATHSENAALHAGRVVRIADGEIVSGAAPR